MLMFSGIHITLILTLSMFQDITLREPLAHRSPSNPSIVQTEGLKDLEEVAQRVTTSVDPSPLVIEVSFSSKLCLSFSFIETYHSYVSFLGNYSYSRSID
jgi:hypothetical protein